MKVKLARALRALADRLDARPVQGNRGVGSTTIQIHGTFPVQTPVVWPTRTFFNSSVGR